MALSTSQQWMSSCIVHLLFLFSFSPLYLLHLIIIILLSFNYKTVIITSLGFDDDSFMILLPLPLGECAEGYLNASRG